MPTDARTKGTPQLLNPFTCRMWECHDRLPEFISQETCREVIDSFVRDGQKHPVLARPVTGVDGITYELIYGARRLFAARHLNMKLLGIVKDIDNAAAFLEMDIENRLRRDISPYERGMSFRAWLRSGHFRSQEEIAKALGLSTTQVCRLLRFSDLPTALVTAFPDPKQIRESWAVTLAERCADPEVKSQVLAIARSVRVAGTCDAKQVYKRLLDTNNPAPGSARVGRRDEVVRSDTGLPIFRISYRYNDLHIVIRRDLASAGVVTELTAAVRTVLSKSAYSAPSTNGARERATTGHFRQQTHADRTFAATSRREIKMLRSFK
jgi:ParB/RepB/Spo0J family partition protein